MCRGFMGCVIVFFNIFYLIVGLILAVVGALLTWTSLLKDPALQLLKQAISQAITGHLSQEEIDATAEQLWAALAPVALVLFCIGVTFFIIAIIAFIGVCCHVMCMLITYAAITGLLVLALTVVIIIYYADKSIIMKKVNEVIEKDQMNYEYFGTGSLSSKIAAIIMQFGQCCGYLNGTDFLNTEQYKYKGKDTFDGTKWIDSTYPLPCCKEISESGTCPPTFTADNSNIGQGCRDAMDKKLAPIFDLIIYGVIAALVINAILFVMAAVRIYLIRREDDSDVEYDEEE